MALDDCRWASDGLRFDHVRIQSSLHQKIHLTQLFSLFLKDLNELVSDDLSLLFGVGDASKGGQKSFSHSHPFDIQLTVIGEGFEDFLKLIFAEQAIVNKDTGEPGANGARNQSCGDRRINASRQSANG